MALIIRSMRVTWWRTEKENSLCAKGHLDKLGWKYEGPT
jgi:hypothetical protein